MCVCMCVCGRRVNVWQLWITDKVEERAWSHAWESHDLKQKKSEIASKNLKLPSYSVNNFEYARHN